MKPWNQVTHEICFFRGERVNAGTDLVAVWVGLSGVGVRAPLRFTCRKTKKNRKLVNLYYAKKKAKKKKAFHFTAHSVCIYLNSILYNTPRVNTAVSIHPRKHSAYLTENRPLKTSYSCKLLGGNQMFI